MRCSALVFLLWMLFLNGLEAQLATAQKAALLDQLSELHFRQSDTMNIPPFFIDQLIDRVKHSDLDFDDQFELRYFLTQISFVDDISGFPALTQSGREHLLGLTSEDTLQSILEPLILDHFKKEHLPELLRINESNAEQVQLNEDHYLVEELLQYQLSPNAKVAELGAGDGVFGLYLFFAKKDIQLFLNEVSEERVGEIYNTLLLLKKQQRQQVAVVRGTSHSTLLEGKELDVLIMRNAFHHFSDPEAMLESIKRSIRPGGTVYLLEQFKERDHTKNHCTLLKERDETEKLFEENGWIKTQEVYLDKQRKHLIQYQLY
jgi:SAM-dependent methyltransferase